MDLGSFSIPGKIFVLGEYAVLHGAPALVGAVGPRFSLRIVESGGDRPREGSPAARAEAWALSRGARKLEWIFEDPWKGAGGFGGSTAEFALVFGAYARREGWDSSWEAAWKLYRELTAGEPLPPSGADLAAQYQGLVVKFRTSPPEATKLLPGLDLSGLQIFSATLQKSRKTATYKHLEDIASSPEFASGSPLMGRLSAICRNGVVACEMLDAPALGRAMNDYAETLSAAGLELGATREDREALRGLPGVLGVKGCGAMQSDALLVLVDEERNRSRVVDVAQARGLLRVDRRLNTESGFYGSFH